MIQLVTPPAPQHLIVLIVLTLSCGKCAFETQARIWPIILKRFRGQFPGPFIVFHLILPEESSCLKIGSIENSTPYVPFSKVILRYVHTGIKDMGLAWVSLLGCMGLGLQA